MVSVPPDTLALFEGLSPEFKVELVARLNQQYAHRVTNWTTPRYERYLKQLFEMSFISLVANLLCKRTTEEASDGYGATLISLPTVADATARTVQYVSDVIDRVKAAARANSDDPACDECTSVRVARQ